MTTSISGTPSYAAGDLVDLPAAQAAEWIREGMAIADPGQDATPADVGVGRAGDVETMTAPPAAEQAVSRRPPRQSRRKTPTASQKKRR